MPVSSKVNLVATFNTSRSERTGRLPLRSGKRWGFLPSTEISAGKPPLDSNPAPNHNY